MDLERYDYPGGYTQYDQGDDWVRARIEELHVDYETTRGAGNARGLATGSRFKLTKYPRDDQNREYLLLSADYQLRSDVFGSSGTANTGPVFHCEFTALDAKTPYRPPRNTPKARVQGPQTAIVVGKAGEELWTDQHGRVKVQFHWDRYGQSDEQSSCWVRVAHPWAGKNWGAVAIPRIGQEVIVDFLEGDPDRPIITGRVYNGVNKPPYGLPAGAAVSGLMSNSTKGGSGYNEYIMDDTKGQELIREHGQFDKDSTIEHDLREHVLHDRSRDVTNNETIQIGKDRAKTVGNDETINIGHDRNETVVNNETISVGSSRTETVGVNQTLSVGANRTEKVGGNETVTVAASKAETIAAAKSESIGAAKVLSIGAAYQVSVGGVMNTSVGGAKMEEVGLYSMQAIGGNLSVKVGNNTAHSTADEHAISATEILLTAKSKITLSVGASTITLTPTLIEIKGPLVKINC